MNETKELYTIGHSNHSTEAFIQLLKKHLINCIVDVRSAPYSKYVPQFNKNEIKKTLSENGIKYVPMGDEFGARRNDVSLFHSKGYLDFDKTARTELFLKGIERVCRGIEERFRIALMCTEQNPLECHRFSLVARSFVQQGFSVIHIMSDGTLQTQEQVEEAMIDEYFPKRITIGLFENENCNRELLISQAFALKNADIGYRRSENDGDSSN